MTSLPEPLAAAGHDGPQHAPQDAPEDADLAVAGADAAGETGGNLLDDVELQGILESLLLAAGAPVPLARLTDAVDGPGRAEVARALERLAERYEREARGMRLMQVAGGFQLRSAPQHGPFVRRLLGGKPPRLSRPMLETLAIVAYRQPCTRPEIEAVRGVDCGAAVNSLLERRLVRIEGRKDAPGRPLLYGTTKEFLEVFGLPDLRALPPLRELGDGAELLAAEPPVAAGDAAEAATPVEAAAAAPSPPEPTADAEIPASSMPASSTEATAMTDPEDGDDRPEPLAHEADGFDGVAVGDPPGDGVGVAAAATRVR